MYGYNYNPAFNTYGSTAGAHAGYEEREAWPARSPPNYATTAPYQYQEVERPPRGAAGVSHSMVGGGAACTANCW